MFEKINAWHKKLTPFKKLAFSFTFNWIIWFATSWLCDKFFFEEKHSVAYNLYSATFMAVFMTLFFNLNLVKLIFFKKKHPI